MDTKEEIKSLLEKTAGFVKINPAMEAHLRKIHSKDSEYGFLYMEHPLHSQFRAALEDKATMKPETPVAPPAKKRNRWSDAPVGIVQTPVNDLNSQATNPSNTTQNKSGTASIDVSSSKQPVSSSQHQQEQKMILERHQKEDFKTFEEIPVGLLAETIRKDLQKRRDWGLNSTQYTPLEPESLPKVLPQAERPNELVRAKIESFYKFLDEERDNEKRFWAKRDRMTENESSRPTGFSNRREGPEISRGGRPQVDVNEAMMEMGLRVDGRAQPANEERRGLGTTQEDMYSAYRKQRSMQFQVAIEERYGPRETPSDVCFLCRIPGHLARECKLGLN
eukprot:TRINITY_DN5304_c0_g1_i1.p1 TRINITY_DN5304_c0_g1~~TRINITY_DN5304_c0_g1_i1.p1  ORF type:complete len:335 (-),score=36.55 TRINITY_DN5304_c0_g1_i1:91-1095(-)